MIRSVTVGCAVIFAGAASAADLPSRKGAPPAPVASGACLEKNGLSTDVFGFNTGSDVADYQSLGASLTYNGAYGARLGGFNGHTFTGQISYGLLPCVEIGPYLLGGWSTTTGLAPNVDGRFFGGGVEAKWKVLGRDTHGVGLTFDLMVQGQGTNGSLFSPTRSVFDTIASVFIDRELVAGKLYGALNASYDFNSRDRVNPGDFTDTSVLRLGAALSWQLVDGFYVGADLNHYRRYSTSFFGSELGNATFAGPNFYWQATPKLAVTAAYNVQLAGKVTGFGGAPGNLDLANFNQHMFKMKLAYSF